ncbi:transposase domain-containing protein [Lacticaseibacillus pantheris]
MIQSAKANGIDEREYIEFLLEHISQLPTFAKDSELEAYLPWNYTVPSKISVEA